MRKLITVFSILLLVSTIIPYEPIAFADTMSNPSDQNEKQSSAVDEDELESNEQTIEFSEDEDVEEKSDTDIEDSQNGIKENFTNDEDAPKNRKDYELELEKQKDVIQNSEKEEPDNEEKIQGEEETQRVKNETLSVRTTEQKISRLGHIRKASVKIYNDLTLSSSFQAGSTYTHQVYYIKKQASLGDQLYYLISMQPSSTKGTVGWVKSSDLSTHPHTRVDKDSKVFYVKGTGKAYSKAWGGSKDLVYNLSKLKGEVFQVHMTEKVGKNTWYRGKLKGKTVWVHESYLSSAKHTPYNLTLDQAVNIQLKASPQTDQKYAYVSSSYIDKNDRVTASTLNVRKGAGTAYKIVGSLKIGDKVSIISEHNGWYVIDFKGTDQWVNARPEDVRYYLDPNNFIHDEKQQFQFLDLSKPSGASKTVLNNYLKGKGILAGRAQAFIDGGRQNGINDVYLISHATLETGNGSSELANGIEVGKNKSGKLVLVTKSNRGSLTNIKKVYNMYGIGANDACAKEGGARRSYQRGWT